MYNLMATSPNYRIISYYQCKNHSTSEARVYLYSVNAGVAD